MRTTTLHSLLMDEEPIATGELAFYPWSKELVRKFSGVSRFGDPYKMYEEFEFEGKKYIGVPRGVCPMGEQDLRVEGKVIDFQVAFKPRSLEQARVREETTAFLKEGKSGIVVAQTGFGKTPTALASVGDIGRKTLVVVTKEDLQQQWAQEACSHLQLKSSEVGIIRQDTFQVTDRKVVVGLVNSLIIEGRYPDWLRDEFGLVVFDECHRMAADTFRRAVQSFTAKLRLALTATLERQDGKEALVMANIGPVRVTTSTATMVPKVLRFQTNWQCPRIKKINKKTGKSTIVRMPHSAGRAGRVLKRLTKDPDRNILLATITKRAYEKGRKIVFFSDLTEHLKEIRSLLIQMGVPASDMAKYYGPMSMEDIERAKAKPLLLATYKKMGEGSNIPWLDFCVLGTPRSEVEQIVGRIRREYPDKSQPIVADMVDADSPVFNSAANKRLRWYRRISADVVATASPIAA